MSDQVLADVRLLSTVTNRIRLYSLLCVEAMDAILAYCVKEKMEVSLGVWVNKVDAANRAELARLKVVLDKYGKTGVIKDVVVGNEAVFVVGVSIAVLAAEMKLVRKMLQTAGSDAKIGTAEIYNVWKGRETADIEGDQFSFDGDLDMTPIVEQSDWIGLNTHSYYGGVSGSSGDAGAYVRNEWADIQGEFGKPVAITETGFPTRGEIRTTDFGTTKPGEKELELFASQVEEKSRENGFAVYFFEFADGWFRVFSWHITPLFTISNLTSFFTFHFFLFFFQRTGREGGIRLTKRTIRSAYSLVTGSRKSSSCLRWVPCSQRCA